MMRKQNYPIEFNAKTIAVLAVVCGGFGVAVYAQSPAALPPASPAAPSAPLSPGELPVDLSKLPIALPSQAAEKEPAKKDSFGKPVGSDSAALADLPPPAAESTDKQVATLEKKADAEDAARHAKEAVETKDEAELASPPPLDVPSLTPSLSAPGTDMVGASAPPPLGEPTSLPEVNVAPEKPKEKTWATKLAPSSISPETTFNYRRVVLPGTIYRPEYAEYNKHLPTTVTRQDYANLLFSSVVSNDVETTRTLLNAGVDINVMAGNGETPLAAARRAGAMATAQLLMARGGH